GPDERPRPELPHVARAPQARAARRRDRLAHPRPPAAHQAHDGEGAGPASPPPGPAPTPPWPPPAVVRLSLRRRERARREAQPAGGLRPGRDDRERGGAERAGAAAPPP